MRDEGGKEEMGDRLKEIHQKGQSPLKDLIIISAIAIFVFVMAIILDAHEMIMKWAHQYENWQVDELLTMLTILPFTFALFSIRWIKKLRYQISERKRTEGELKKHRDHLGELVEQRISEVNLPAASSGVSKTLNSVIPHLMRNPVRSSGFRLPPE
jgi:hypothetical protein